jgi:hypothetical protein
MRCHEATFSGDAIAAVSALKSGWIEAKTVTAESVSGSTILAYDAMINKPGKSGIQVRDLGFIELDGVIVTEAAHAGILVPNPAANLLTAARSVSGFRTSPHSSSLTANSPTVWRAVTSDRRLVSLSQCAIL